MDFNECMSRRAMLKAAGAATVAAAAVGTSSARADETATDQQWDEEHEFVIVGAGGSLFAGLAALHEGADVVVFEKDSNYGGTTFLSAGAIWVPNNNQMPEATRAQESAELAVEYLENCDMCGDADIALIEDWVRKAPQVNDYINDSLGLHIIAYNEPQSDYYGYDGCLVDRTLHITNEDSTVERGGWDELLRPVVDASGLDIRLSAPVTELVADESGAVVGVVAEGEGGPVRIRATKGVLLATGSFDRNQALVDAFLCPKPLYTAVTLGCTGDGLTMGMALGADVAHLNASFNLCGAIGRNGEMGSFGLMSFPAHCIIVNCGGKRFCNESASYDEVGRAVCQYDTTGPANGKTYCLSGRATAIFDAEYVATRGGFPFGEFTDATEEMPGWIRPYETLEDLAAGEGIDPTGLLEEIERFNGFCETGVDEDFHRGEGPYDNPETGLGSLHNPWPSGGENAFLGPISEPPFYAATVGRGHLGTAGGLVVNENCQVLRNGEPIPGLYACGCVADSLVNGYPGGGYPVNMSISRGIIAADHALGLGIIE